MRSRLIFSRLAMAVAATVILLAACGHSSESVAPSSLSANPDNYDQADVTVTGTAKNLRTRQFRRGTVTLYQLCDSACVNVVAFGSLTNVSEGSKVTVSGRFHTTFGRRRIMNNVLVVGGRMRPAGGGSP